MPPSSFPPVTGQFPQVRLRRNRTHGWSRNLMCENQLTAHDLIWPVFVREEGIAPDFKTMPDIKRLTVSELLSEVGRLVSMGLQSIMLFPVIALEKRDEAASHAFDEDGLLCQAVRALKAAFPQVGVITDVALDPYTSHGQDGLVIDGKIDNDETLKALARHALVQARAGADVIAPSEMMDGRVGFIRRALDTAGDAAGYSDVGIMSYAAKYASCLYGPFREALGSNACLGKADKKTYQMDPANLDEALREVALDLQEGADSIIIKPGIPYLDVVRRVKDTFKIPTILFHVSAEYAMLYHAAKAGVFDFDAALMESLLCCKRAGANGIISYGTPRVLEIMNQQRMKISA